MSFSKVLGRVLVGSVLAGAALGCSSSGSKASGPAGTDGGTGGPKLDALFTDPAVPTCDSGPNYRLEGTIDGQMVHVSTSFATNLDASGFQILEVADGTVRNDLVLTWSTPLAEDKSVPLTGASIRIPDDQPAVGGKSFCIKGGDFGSRSLDTGAAGRSLLFRITDAAEGDCSGASVPVSLGGCIFRTNTYFPGAVAKPPPMVDAGPRACKEDPSVNCNASTLGHRCTGGVIGPDDLDKSLSCPLHFTDGTSCCGVPPAGSTCATDAAITCAGGTTGYSCTGSDTPAQSNDMLVCGQRMDEGAGKSGYCCSAYSSPSCTVSTTISGCPNYAFSCNGSAHPWDTDASLRCGEGTQSLNDVTLFCCTVRDPSAPKTCMPDPATDCSPAMAYSCTGPDSPSDDDPSLVCGAPTPSGGKNLYCCR